MERGDIRPPGVVLDCAEPTVSMPEEGVDILDPGWKGLNPSNSSFLDADSFEGGIVRLWWMGGEKAVMDERVLASRAVVRMDLVML